MTSKRRKYLLVFLLSALGVPFLQAGSSSSARLSICRVAGPGTPSLVGFHLFAQAPSGVSDQITFLAGPCTVVGLTSGSTVTVQEDAVANVSVTSIASTLPLTSASLLTRSIRLTFPATGNYTVTFTDALTSNLGSLSICKVAGPGVTPGAPFPFTVLGTGIHEALTANAGACAPSLPLPIGTQVAVQEAASPSTTVSAISGGTGANILTGMVNATIASGAATTITYTNKALGNQGCGQGYYKRHVSGALASSKVGAWFSGLPASLANETLPQALKGGGGPGVLGAEEIMLRSAVTALLNSLNPAVQYQFNTSTVVMMVNTAIASNDRATILALADQLENANEAPGGCPAGA